ncbi:MAG: membrane lipoprotein lipid attachment site-containing protein [Patescibacteria group bacterium]|jgi:hypothetical protein
MKKILVVLFLIPILSGCSFIKNNVVKNNNIAKTDNSAQDNNLNLATTTGNTQISNLNNDICKTATFTPPLEQEIAYNNEIKQDEYVKYLRRSLDDYLSSNFSTQSRGFGLIDGIHYADSAYGNFNMIDPAYLKSKFIVLSTDFNPFGGKGITLIFKNKPDRIFYAWVYRYIGVGYDLRDLSDYEKLQDGSNGVKEVQAGAINQLCNDEFGL